MLSLIDFVDGCFSSKEKTFFWSPYFLTFFGLCEYTSCVLVLPSFWQF